MPLHLLHAEGVLHTELVELLTGRLTGGLLRFPEVLQRTELRGHVFAGVDGHHRDAGGDRPFHHALKRVGLGERDHDAVDLLVNRVLDQRRLPACVLVARVEELDVVLGGGVLGARLNDVPEGVTGRGVGDHRDPQPRSVDRRGGLGCVGLGDSRRLSWLRWSAACAARHRRNGETPGHGDGQRSSRVCERSGALHGPAP